MTDTTPARLDPEQAARAAADFVHAWSAYREAMLPAVQQAVADFARVAEAVRAALAATEPAHGDGHASACDATKGQHAPVDPETPTSPHADAESFYRMHSQSGVHTPGCDCHHDGMGAIWHDPTCTWRATIPDTTGMGRPAPTDEDLMVTVETALEEQLLPDPGFAVLERSRDAVMNAVAPLLRTVLAQRDQELAKAARDTDTACEDGAHLEAELVRARSTIDRVAELIEPWSDDRLLPVSAIREALTQPAP